MILCTKQYLKFRRQTGDYYFISYFQLTVINIHLSLKRQSNMNTSKKDEEFYIVNFEIKQHIIYKSLI